MAPQWLFGSPALVLAAGLLVWFGPWLAASEPRMGGDVTLEFYPRLVYGMGELRRGALPLWTAQTMAGTPLLANPQVGLLYPLHWPLLSVLPIGSVLNYAAILHLGLAAVGTYALARRWAISPAGAALAAVSYGFNGMFVARLWAGNLSLLEMLAWLPVLLLAAEVYGVALDWRGWAGLAGAATLSLLVGFYQPWLLSMLAGAAYLAYMPGQVSTRVWRLVGLAFACFVAAAIAAPQLLPAYELIQWTTRGGRLDWEFATAASLPLWHLPSLLLPELFGSGAGTYWPGPWWQWHELTAYAGLLALVLAPLGWIRPRETWVRYCGGLLVVALVLALGRHTPVYEWFYSWVPGYGNFRDPSRHLMLVSLAIALLAGRGADRLLGGQGYRAVMMSLLGLFLVCALAVLVILQASDSLAAGLVPYLEGIGVWSRHAETTEVPADALGATTLRLVARAFAMASLAATAALVAVVLGRAWRRTWRAGILVVALFGDLTLFGWRYIHEPLPPLPGVPFGTPAEQFSTMLGSNNVAGLQQAAGVWRVAVLGQEGAVAGNAGYLLGFPVAAGLDPLLPRRYAELVALANGQPVAAFEQVLLFLEDTPSPLWPLLNAHYRLVPRSSAGRSPLKFELQEAANVLPRAFIVNDLRLVDSAKDSLVALADPTFDPGVTAVIEARIMPATMADDRAAVGAAGDPIEGTGPARARLDRYLPGEILVSADLPRPGALLVLEAWHPGWKAWANGQPVAVSPADHAFMAMLLPAGQHEVLFRFAPDSLLLGLQIAATTAALLGLGALLLLVRCQRQRRLGTD
jgi:hypothetical protein